MDDERKTSARTSIQRIVGGVLVLLGVLLLAMPFWFPGIKMTTIESFLTPIPYIGLPVIWLGLVLARTTPRAKNPD